HPARVLVLRQVLHAPEGAARDDRRLDPVEPSPAIESPVGLDDACKQLVRGTSSSVSNAFSRPAWPPRKDRGSALNRSLSTIRKRARRSGSRGVTSCHVGRNGGFPPWHGGRQDALRLAPGYGLRLMGTRRPRPRLCGLRAGDAYL